LKVALIQFCSQNNKAENLLRLSSLINTAASNGAEVVVLPEMFSFMGSVAGTGDPGDALGS
jgi:predicted amidohydrolase